MSTKQTEALKLALEALERYSGIDQRACDAEDAIREALAEQPVQQGCMRCNTPKKCALFGCSPLAWPAEQPAQQEPVAWRWTESNGQHWFDWTTDWTHHDRAKAMGFAIEYAYTSLQPSKPLTDEQIGDLWNGHTLPVFGKTGINPIVFARAIEAAHGIK